MHIAAGLNITVARMRYQKMRIYAVADIHGKPARMARIHKKMSELNPDALIAAGDITGYLNPDPVINQLNQMPAPVLGIRGNSDLKKVDRMLDDYPNTFSLHLKTLTISGTCFVGVSGTVAVPFCTRLGWHEKRIFNRLAALVDNNSVLVVHAPPRGRLDEVFGRFHAGCRRLHQLVVKRQPRLVLCGHIHECPGIASIGPTTVVNCSVAGAGGGAVLDFNAKNSFRVTML